MHIEVGQVCLFLIAAIFAAALQGQTSRGTVTGIVTDASGAAVPGATVELKATQTGVVRPTTTNESGVYRFDAVDLGEHDLTVKAPGFKTTANRSLNVQAAQTVGLDVRLEVGDNVSIVEVSARSGTAADRSSCTRRQYQLSCCAQSALLRPQSGNACDYSARGKRAAAEHGGDSYFFRERGARTIE